MYNLQSFGNLIDELIKHIFNLFSIYITSIRSNNRILAIISCNCSLPFGN